MCWQGAVLDLRDTVSDPIFVVTRDILGEVIQWGAMLHLVRGGGFLEEQGGPWLTGSSLWVAGQSRHPEGSKRRTFE